VTGRARISTLILLLSGVGLHAAAVAGLPDASPTRLGFDADRLSRLDGVIDRAIEQKKIPGAVVLVGRRGCLAYARAAGLRAVSPGREPMTRDTVFDLASLTKPIATTTAVMMLVEEGAIRLSDRITHFLPEFDNHGKGEITVEHLLRHRAGLIADNPIRDYEQGADAAWKKLAELDLMTRPGAAFRYSDVGFLILGKLVARQCGKPLDVFAKERIFEVLGMKDTQFRPLASSPTPAVVPAERIAPTERDAPNGQMLRGVVHDPRARALGGVAGHAGLFGTADDLALFVQTLLNGGRGPGGQRILSPLAVRALVDAATTPENERRGLGWDVQTSYSAPRGSLFGPNSFGHTGFTGTSVWIDPETETFVIILTSRLHPDGRAPSPGAFRSEIATVVAAAIADEPARPALVRNTARGEAAASSRTNASAHAGPIAASAPVLCGIDVVAEEGFQRFRGLKLGLVTNHTGLARDGRSTIDVLFHAADVKLVKLFGPEHGIRGELDAAVPDGKDPVTGLPVISLYSKDRKPRAADLEGLDALVYDIQDVGTRFYTYITTLGLVLEAAGQNGKKLFVLDRPNPIGGTVIGGPVRDDDLGSFIAYHTLPVRHGLTVGELALLYNAERKIGAQVEVIRCRGWSRERSYDRTGLLWINPSPNMRSLTEALLYPGVGLLEATNVATGRGTDVPFERVGAPWIDPVAFAAALNAAGVAGARFVPIYFTPSARQHAGKRCGGVQILITSWADLDPVRLGVTLAVTLQSLYSREWEPGGLLRLLCDRAGYQDIICGKSVDQIMRGWEGELADFQTRRAPYLLY
jgi:uncharacterized protein YbbC (DUF1343 family)/CubicO group peptidase (beta-lactamase class C family)